MMKELNLQALGAVTAGLGAHAGYVPRHKPDVADLARSAALPMRLRRVLTPDDGFSEEGIGFGSEANGDDGMPANAGVIGSAATAAIQTTEAPGAEENIADWWSQNGGAFGA